MDESTQNNQKLYQCKECLLHYKDKETAEKCEKWCREHKTCNVEITKQAEENKSQELERKCQEYLNNWKRAEADFINYKKDEAERISALIRYAKEDIVLSILPILDNIELAERQLPEKLKKGEGESHAVEWTKGFLQIKKQIEEFLRKEGIEEIEISGQNFNPEIMEIVEEVEGSNPGTVAEELQKGYIMNGKVIRPAKVKISK